MIGNSFDFGNVEMLDHTRLKPHDPDWWKSEEYKLVERIFNRVNIFDENSLKEKIKMKMLDNKKVNSLKEVRTHVVDYNKQSIFSALNRIVEDVVGNGYYDAFINTGYSWEEIVNTDGYLDAVEEFRSLPEYETDIILVDGVEMFAIKVLPM